MSLARRVAFVALCLASVAHAADPTPERWLVAKASDGSIAYDAAGITRDAETGIVTVTIALYPGETLTSPAGHAWQYMRSQTRLDCANGKFQVSSTLLYGAGQDLVEVQDEGPQPWQPIAGNAVIEVARDVACKGQALDATREAATFEGAMALMKDMGR